MSDRAAVIHITLKAIAKIEELSDEDGVKLQIVEPPSYRTDLSLIAAVGSEPLSKDQTDRLTNAMEYVVAQLFAKALKVPDNIQEIEPTAAPITKVGLS